MFWLVRFPPLCRSRCCKVSRCIQYANVVNLGHCRFFLDSCFFPLPQNSLVKIIVNKSSDKVFEKDLEAREMLGSFASNSKVIGINNTHAKDTVVGSMCPAHGLYLLLYVQRVLLVAIVLIDPSTAIIIELHCFWLWQSNQL